MKKTIEKKPLAKPDEAKKDLKPIKVVGRRPTSSQVHVKPKPLKEENKEEEKKAPKVPKGSDILKKDIEAFNFETLKAEPENAGVTRTLFATYILLYGNSLETTKIVANGFAGAWEFLKDRLDKKTFSDK